MRKEQIFEYSFNKRLHLKIKLTDFNSIYRN